MANNNGKVSDQLNKDHSNKLTKGAGFAFRKSTELVAKGTAKAASLAARISLRIIRRVITALCSSFVATIVIVILVLSCLTGLIVGTAIKMTSETNMKQESPELTKAYLNLNKDEFKQKIYELVNDKAFNSYVLAGEFDNAYTKLVYGGTPAYSQKELKGYAKADESDTQFVKFTAEGKNLNKDINGAEKLINDISSNNQKEMLKILKKKDATSIYPMRNKSKSQEIINKIINCYKNEKNDSKARNKALNQAEKFRKNCVNKCNELLKKGGYAKCTSLLQALQKYKDAGLPDSKIKINDDYLRGYGEASGYKEATKNEKNTDEHSEENVMPFNKWVNYSYYAIPYYFHVNQARHSTYKNQMGGTLEDSMSFYANLSSVFGAEIIKSIGGTLFKIGVLKKASDEVTYKEYKKGCDELYGKLKGKKNEKNRKKLANNLIAKYKAQNKLGDGLIGGGAAIYAGGFILEVNSIAALLKTIANHPQLQYGAPNWNRDTGDWRFMTLETKNVEKYPSKFKLAHLKTTISGSYTADADGGTEYIKSKYRNNRPIWNNQTSITAYFDEGGGYVNPAINFLNKFVGGCFGRNAEYDGNATYEKKYKQYNNEDFRKMSYKDILKTKFTSLHTKDITDNFSYSNYAKKKLSKYYPAQGVMLGYKMESVQTSEESTQNEMLGYDGLYNYAAFSKHARDEIWNFNYDANEMKKVTTDFKNGFIDDLYIYNWEEMPTKNDKKNHLNYYNYLREPKDIDAISKREEYSKYSKNNTLINTLKEQFANYFINQIYYIYSDNIHDSTNRDTETGGGSDYIHDFFLSKGVSKHKKIEFLQRSFYAMASGSSYTYQATEEYKVENGSVINKLNGRRVGGLELNTKIQVNYLNKLTTPISKITKAYPEGVDVEDDNREAGNNPPITDGKQGWGDNFTVYLDNDYTKAINRIKVFNSVNNNGWNIMGWSNNNFTKVTPSMTQDGNIAVWPGCYTTEGTTNQGFKYIVAIDGDNKAENLKIYYDGVLITKDKNKKENKTKCNVILEIKPTNQKDLLAQKFTIKVNGQNQKFEKLFYKHVNWNKDFYKTHKEDIDGQNYNFNVSMDKGYDKANFNINSLTAKQLSPEEITKFLNGELDGSFPMFANITGDRDIVIDYNTAGFLSYEIDEGKNEKGKVTEVTASVYMKLPDVDMETRLAYMWEKEGMLENAVKLYDIYKKQNNLKDAESKVDLNELIINYKASEEIDNIEMDGTYNSSLPKGITNEVIKATFETQVKFGIPCSSTFAQMMLESGPNLDSDLAKTNKNLFGTGVHSKGSKQNRWVIGSKVFATKQADNNGTLYGTNQNFSAYKNFHDSIYDRATMLINKDMSYYKQVKKYLNTKYLNGKVKNMTYKPETAVEFIHSFNYASKSEKQHSKKTAWAQDCGKGDFASSYVGKCKNLMDRYNLYAFDNMTLAEFQSTYSGEGSVVVGDRIQSIIDAAYSQAGKKYQSPPSFKYDGKHIPNTFDCSSLVMFALWKGGGIGGDSFYNYTKKIFKTKGLRNIGNSTDDQPKYLTAIAKSKQNLKRKKKGNGDWWLEEISKSTPTRNLQRGDIVYYSGHVVIYVGNNKQFHASDHYRDFTYKKNKKTKKQYKYWTRDILESNFQGTSSAVHIYRFHFTTTAGLASKIKKDQGTRLSWLFNGKSLPRSPQAMKKWLTTIKVPIINSKGKQTTMNLTVHKKLAEEYKKIFIEMCRIRFPIKPATTAAYVWKVIDNSGGKRSQHSYGVAIDVNWGDNPCYSTNANVKNGYLGYKPGKNKYSVTQQVIKIWKFHGFGWGGDWIGKKDTMHFSYTE